MEQRRMTRAQRARQRRKRRIKRLRALMIIILVIISVVSGVRLAGALRLRGSDSSVPLLLQTDPRWADAPYGSSTVGISGCGPTCISMVLTALKGGHGMTPDEVSKFSENNGYYVNGVGTSWSLMTDGAKRLGLKVREVPLDEGIIGDKLSQGYPIIASVSRGDFTDEGHFIVLTSYENGEIRVNDPNSRENSSKMWAYNRLAAQITALWMYGT